MGMQAAKNAIDIGIIVKDIDKSLEFYGSLLGLEKVQEMAVWFGTMHRMACGDSFVKLIDPKKVPPQGKTGLANALGFRYLTFQVNNIEDVYTKCVDAGIPIELEKQELMPGVTIAMVRDPDSNVVEFVQRA